MLNLPVRYYVERMNKVELPVEFGLFSMSPNVQTRVDNVFEHVVMNPKLAYVSLAWPTHHSKAS